MAFKPKFRSVVLAATLALGYAAPAAAEPVSLITLIATKLAADYAIYIAVAGMLVSTVQQRRKAKKAEAAQKRAYNASLTDRTQTLLSEEMPLTTIYGQPGPLGGAMTAVFTHGAKDEFKSVVVIYASHPCTSFDGCFLDGVSIGDIGPDGWVTSGDFAGARSDQYFDMRVNFDSSGNTTVAGNINSVSLSQYPDSAVDISYPTASTTKLHVQDLVGAVNANNLLITGNRTTYSSKLRVTAHINGDGIADANLMVDSGGQWTADHKLTGMTYIVYTFDLREAKFQQGFPNITAKFKGKAVYDPRDGKTKYTRNNALCLADFITSPYGYDATRESINQASWISAANACDESFFDTTTDYDYQLGSTLARYTCDGSFTTAQERESIRQDLEESMAGNCYESGGVWVMKAGVWSAPILDLTDRDLLAPVQVVQSSYAGNERFNSVRVGYVNAAGVAAGIADDAPPYQNLDLIALDNNEERWDSLSLPFTSSQLRATQLGRVRVEKSRGGLIINLTPRILFWKLQPGDRIRLTHATLGMDAKTFRVQEWVQADTGPISLTCVEDVPAFYDRADLTKQDPAPNTNFKDPFERPAPPISLAAASGVAQLLVNGNSVTPRTKLTWAQSQDVYVLNGGRTQIQWRLAAVEDAWKDTLLAGEATETYLLDPPVGASISIRARFVNSVNSESEWSLIGHTVAGIPSAMAPGSNFSASISGDGIYGTWDSPEGIYGAAWFESQVRVGTTWASGSVLWTGKAVRANLGWLISGARNLMLAHRKIDSDWSTAVNFGITIRNPGTPVVTASAGYGTGTATWPSSATDQPISYYDVRRGSATSDFNSAVPMAKAELLRADFNEPSAGTFRYFVQAVDVAGNKSGVGQSQVDVSGTGIPGGANLPAAGTDGSFYYLNTTKTLYTWINNRWTPVGVQSGSTLPAASASVEGDTYIKDGTLYRYTSGAWAPAIINFAQFASDIEPVRIVTSIPTSYVAKVISYNNVLYTWNGSKYANIVADATIADGSITLAKFASGIEPVTLVSTLPASKLTSQVTLTTDGLLYRWDAAQGKYIKTVDASNITGSVVAAQIAAGAIDSTKIASNLGMIQNVTTLPTAKVAGVNSVLFNGELYSWNGTAYSKLISTANLSGKISGTSITDGTITTAQLSVNSVSADDIQALAIVAGKIAANAITAGTIAAGAVTAREIAAGAITTEKLTVSALSSESLILNGGFEDGLQMWYAGASNVPSQGYVLNASSAGTNQGVYEGKNVARLSRLNESEAIMLISRAVPVVPGDTYRLRFAYRSLNGLNCAFHLAVGYAAKENDYITSGNAASLGGTWAGLNPAFNALVVNNTAWAVYEYVFTIPAGMYWASFAPHNWSFPGPWQGACHLDIDDFSLNRVIASAMIKDGAITTPKLVAGAVTTDTLAANAVTADKIVANAITAGKIAAGAISAREIAAGAITAEKLSVIQQEASLIFNPSFEESGGVGPAGTGLFPLGWSFNTYAGNSGTGDWGVSAGGASDGYRYLWMGRKTSAAFMVLMSRAVPVTPGEKYVLRFKYKIGGGQANLLPYVFTRPTKPTGEFITYGMGGTDEAAVTTMLPGGGIKVQTGGAYVVYEQVFTVPAGQNWLSLAIHHYSGVWTGETYMDVDEFSLRKQTTSAYIADGAITTDRLAAGAITADKLSVNSVSADAIQANAITTAKIAAGAISADQIAAGAITAAKLSVGDFENYVGSQKSAEGWTAGTTYIENPTDWTYWWNQAGETGNSCLLFTRRNNMYGKPFPVKPGDQFYVKALTVPAGGGASLCPVGLGFVATTATGAVAANPYPMLAYRTAGTQNAVKREGTYVVPSDVAFLQIYLLLDCADADASKNGYAHHLGNMEVRRKNNAELIVDGAITAVKIKAGAIESDKLAVGAVTAGKVAANAIVSTNIQAGEIKAVNLGAGSITAEKLAVGRATGNLVRDSEFYQGNAGTRFYSRVVMAQYGANSTQPSMMTDWWINGPDDTWHPRGASAFGLGQNNADYAGNDQAGYYAQLYSDLFTVDPSTRYEFSYYSGAHRCHVFCVMIYYDANGNGLGESRSSVENAAEMAGGTALSNWKRIGGFSVSPANAATARLAIRKGATYPGQTNSYLFACRPMVAVATVNQTEFSPYAPSGAGVLITPTGIDTPSLSALSATIGLLRTAGTGARMELEANQLRVYDASNVLRVRLGLW